MIDGDKIFFLPLPLKQQSLISSKNHKITRTTLNQKQKIAIVTFKNQNPHVSNNDLVDWVKKNFNLEIHPSTISHIIKY